MPPLFEDRSLKSARCAPPSEGSRNCAHLSHVPVPGGKRAHEPTGIRADVSEPNAWQAASSPSATSTPDAAALALAGTTFAPNLPPKVMRRMMSWREGKALARKYLSIGPLRLMVRSGPKGAARTSCTRTVLMDSPPC